MSDCGKVEDWRANGNLWQFSRHCPPRCAGGSSTSHNGARWRSCRVRANSSRTDSRKLTVRWPDLCQIKSSHPGGWHSIQTCLELNDSARELRAERESRGTPTAWGGHGGDRGNRANEGLPDACITTKRTCRDTRTMSRQDLFERLLSSLHEAMLDDAYWPATSALMDEACGSKGNILVSGDACAAPHCAIFLARWFYRGQRHEDYETEYFNVYHHRDERGPRLRQLPDSKIVNVEELYTDEEKRSSLAYNEIVTRSDTGNCLHARLDGPDDSWIVWTAANPVDDAGWSSQRVETVARILPHVRQFVRVRLALANARALGSTMTTLLDNTRSGIIQLDPRGRIVADQRACTQDAAKGRWPHRRQGASSGTDPTRERDAPEPARTRAAPIRRSRR